MINYKLLKDNGIVPKSVSKKDILAKPVVDDDGKTINGKIIDAEKLSSSDGYVLWRVTCELTTDNKYGKAMAEIMNLKNKKSKKKNGSKRK